VDAEQEDFESYRHTQFPLAGLTVSEVTAALAVLPAGALVLRLDTRRDGWLFVQTGRFAGVRAGSGQEFLLRRTVDGWVVEKAGSWRA
jgi:hypothetical protein